MKENKRDKDRETEAGVSPEVLSLLGNGRFYTDVCCCSLLGSLANSTIDAAIIFFSIFFSFYNINSN